MVMSGFHCSVKLRKCFGLDSCKTFCGIAAFVVKLFTSTSVTPGGGLGSIFAGYVPLVGINRLCSATFEQLLTF